MSQVEPSHFTPREIALLRTALASAAPAAAADLGRAGVAAHLLWRARVGSLARPPAP